MAVSAMVCDEADDALAVDRLRGPTVVAVVAELAAIDVDHADGVGVDRILQLARHIDGWVAATKVAAARRIEQLRAEGAAVGRIETMAGRLWGKTEAGQLQRRATVLQSAPALEAALADGSISPTHVDAFGAAMKITPAVADEERRLAGAAATMPPDDFAVFAKRAALLLLSDDDEVERFERQRRDTGLRRWVDARTGMYHLSGQFDPERGAQIWTAIDVRVKPASTEGTRPTWTTINAPRRHCIN